jgi:hypothetical protein
VKSVLICQSSFLSLLPDSLIHLPRVSASFRLPIAALVSAAFRIWLRTASMEASSCLSGDFCLPGGSSSSRVSCGSAVLEGLVVLLGPDWPPLVLAIVDVVSRR